MTSLPALTHPTHTFVTIKLAIWMILMGIVFRATGQAPYVAATFPEDQAENLACNFALTASLSFPSEAKALDPITLTTETVKLYPQASPDSLVPYLHDFNENFGYLKFTFLERLKPHTAYTFEVTNRLADNRGFYFRPFTLHFQTGACEEAPIPAVAEAAADSTPIDLIDTGTQIEIPTLNLVGDSVQIRWRTRLEFLTNYFLVERADSTFDFQPIGKVRGAGESRVPQSYFWLDPGLSPGVYYYRILAVDQLDGVIFSDTAQAFVNGILLRNRLLAQGEPLELRFIQAQKSTMVTLIYTREREVVKRSAGFLEPGETIKQISLEELNPGDYIVIVQTPDGRMAQGIRILPTDE